MNAAHTIAKQTAAALALAVLCGAAHAQNLSPVPADKAEQLKALIGGSLTAKPARERSVLVFWRCEGFVHGKAIEYGNKAIELAAATGAFKADFSNDYEALRPQNIARYDAIVLNNTTALKTSDNPFIEPALTAFVRSGKGLAVIHAGADNFNNAPSAAEMVGGIFWGHPWGSGGTWAFKLDDPASPLNKVFNGQSFKLSDEIYQMRSPYYNRAKLHVLISLDLSDKATAEAKGQQRDDKDFAVSWIRPYGKGRVFYTSFAHDERAFLQKNTLTHILDGIQYATGDLKADDTPAGLSPADLTFIKTATDANAAFGFMQDIIANTHHAATGAANRAKIEALLKDPATTTPAKQAILRLMLATGAPKDLLPVGACLTDPATSAAAFNLLAGTPAKDAAKILTQALKAKDADIRATAIAALVRHNAAGAIAGCLADPDPAVATAALAALGRIPTEEALQALSKPAATPALEDTRLSALAACIGTLADAGKTRSAARAAKTLFDNNAAPAAIRAAAARALLLADAGFFAQGIKDPAPAVRATLIRAADAVPAKALAAALPAAAPADQAALLTKLANRGAADAVPQIAPLINAADPDVAIAALAALTKLGAPAQVPAICALLEKDGAVAKAAADALTDMPGIGRALLDYARKNPASHKKMFPILGNRNESALIAAFQPFTTDASDETRREVWKALGRAGDDRAFPQLLAWLPAVKDAESNQAEAALRTTARYADPETRSAALAAAWKAAANTPAKKTLAALMPAYASDAFIPLMAAALSDSDNSVRDATLRAFADWPSLAPYDTLKTALAQQTDNNLKNTALRSALKLINAHAGNDSRARFIELFKAAPSDGARMDIANAIFRRDGLELFAVLRQLAGDPAAGAAAKKTFVTFYDEKLKGQAGGAAVAKDIDPKNWKVNASHAGNDARRAIDRNPGSRWSSNRGSEKGMWYTVDLGENAFIAEIVLDTEQSAGDTPNGYEVFTSHDGKEWAGPVTSGDGNTRGKTVIPMSSSARHLKIVTTGGRSGLHWSIHELYVKSGIDQKKVEEIGKIADTLR